MVPLPPCPPAVTRLARAALLAGVPLQLLIGGCVLGSGGAGAPLSAGSNAPEHSLMHLPVPPAPALDPVRPELWIALAPRLGGGDALVLRAAQGRLGLTAASGERWEAPELVLRWRQQPLTMPLRVRRQVLGPFASYESAEAAARRWRRLGVAPLIAHPTEWEVWAPVGAPVPAGLAPRLQEQTWRERLLPELQLGKRRVLLQGPVRLEAPGGLRWQGEVFSGPFRLQPDAHGRWTLLEHVPLERYLLGVVPHEIGAAAPPAALAAQAVLARTWALRNRGRFAVDGYHLCRDTQCQVYGDPAAAGAAVRQAVSATRQLLLSWEGQPIHAVYHASNGGVAAGFEEVWSGDPLPYLRAAVDGSAALQQRFPLPLGAASLSHLLRIRAGLQGTDHPRFRWSRSLDAAQVAAALRPLDPKLGEPRALTVLERGPSGRVLALAVQGSGGALVLRRDAIRRQLRTLPSTLFLIMPEGRGRWRFEGGGFGHGAGLSQAGAVELASRGWSLQRILQHYYPGTQLQRLDQLPPGPSAGAP